MPCNQAWWRFHTGLQPTPARNLSHIPVVFLKFLSILVLLGLPSRSAERDNCPRPKKSSLRSSLFLFFTLDCNPIGSLFAKEGEHTHQRKPRGGGWGGVGEEGQVYFDIFWYCFIIGTQLSENFNESLKNYPHPLRTDQITFLRLKRFHFCSNVHSCRSKHFNCESNAYQSHSGTFFGFGFRMFQKKLCFAFC